MATIGGITVSIMRGCPARLKTRIETWETPGLDGIGAMTLGIGDSMFEISTVTYCADIATAEGHIAALAALQGTSISIVDDWGNTFELILALHVDHQIVPVIWNGNPAAARVECRWRMCQA